MRQLLVLLLVLLVLVASLAWSHKVEVKKRLDLPEEEDEEGEWDLETEILGQKGNIYRGFNILDETTNVIVSDPSERVLRAMVHPEHSAEGLSLEKVKKLYQRQMDGESKAHTRYTMDHFKEMLAREKRATKVKNSEAGDSFFKRIVKMLW